MGATMSNARGAAAADEDVDDDDDDDAIMGCTGRVVTVPVAEALGTNGNMTGGATAAISAFASAARGVRSSLLLLLELLCADFPLDAAAPDWLLGTNCGSRMVGGSVDTCGPLTGAA